MLVDVWPWNILNVSGTFTKDLKKNSKYKYADPDF